MKQRSIRKNIRIRCGRRAAIIAVTATLAVSSLFPASMVAASSDPQEGLTAQQIRDADSASPTGRPSIVGFWFVNLYSGGKVIDQAYYQWHSEHLVATNDNSDPQAPLSVGAVCLGVWKQTGRNTYKVKHPTWSFDANGHLNGKIVLREEITLDADGDSYHGTFVYDVFDPVTDVLTSETTGVVQATRILVD